MRSFKKQSFVILAAVLLALVACRLPGASAPTPIVFPTPNLTMTALYNPDQGIPPTATPVLLFPSATPGTTVQQPSPTAAPVLIPTVTPTPEATATARPATRPGPVVKAPLMWVAPNNIDGNLGDWHNDVTYPINNVVYGAANYTGASDVSGEFRIGWDYRALYIGVRVIDDHVVQTQHGAYIYKGDDVEVQLDTDLYGDFYVNAITADDYQLGFSPGVPPGTSPEAYLWYPSGKAGVPAGVQVGVAMLSNGYVLEIAIPWSVLGIKPRKGMEMGFAISISDNDNATLAVQQTMVSNDPYRKLTDPTTWGTLVFYDPGK